MSPDDRPAKASATTTGRPSQRSAAVPVPRRRAGAPAAGPRMTGPTVRASERDPQRATHDPWRVGAGVVCLRHVAFPFLGVPGAFVLRRETEHPSWVNAYSRRRGPGLSWSISHREETNCARSSRSSTGQTVPVGRPDVRRANPRSPRRRRGDRRERPAERGSGEGTCSRLQLNKRRLVPAHP